MTEALTRDIQLISASCFDWLSTSADGLRCRCWSFPLILFDRCISDYCRRPPRRRQRQRYSNSALVRHVDAPSAASVFCIEPELNSARQAASTFVGSPNRGAVSRGRHTAGIHETGTQDMCQRVWPLGEVVRRWRRQHKIGRRASQQSPASDALKETSGRSPRFSNWIPDIAPEDVSLTFRMRS